MPSGGVGVSLRKQELIELMTQELAHFWKDPKEPALARVEETKGRAATDVLRRVNSLRIREDRRE